MTTKILKSARRQRPDRAECDYCGPFRTGTLRKVGRDDFGWLYRCQGCDEEGKQ